MHIEKHFVMGVTEDSLTATKQRVKMWATDAVYMPNCRKLAIASTGRDIRFYDIASKQCNEDYHLYGKDA